MPYKQPDFIREQSAPGVFNDPLKDMEYATIEEIQQETIWPPEWHAAIGIIPYIKRLKGDLVGLEIGTGKGESAYLILEECHNVKKLYTVDPYTEYKNWKEVVTQERQDRYKETAFKNLARFVDRGVILPSLEKVKEEISEVDFIFIDGADSFEQCYKDFSETYPMLKKRGIFAGHNYQLEDVRSALFEWRDKERVRVPINRVSNFSYFWYKA